MVSTTPCIPGTSTTEGGQDDSVNEDEDEDEDDVAWEDQNVSRGEAREEAHSTGDEHASAFPGGSSNAGNGNRGVRFDDGGDDDDDEENDEEEEVEERRVSSCRYVYLWETVGVNRKVLCCCVLFMNERTAERGKRYIFLVTVPKTRAFCRERRPLFQLIQGIVHAFPFARAS